jgi:lipid A 4'-phosphatase
VGRRSGLAIYAALAAAAALTFSIFPHVDLWAAGWFYRDGFYLADSAVLRLVFRAVYWVTDALAILLPLALLIVLWRQRPFLGLDRLAATFLIVALAIGPGLVVNTVLKDHWGRARPSQIVEFGGAKQFTPALEPSDQCNRNCSFPAGHPAIAFYFVSFAMLIPATRRKRMVFGGAVIAGALLGLMRMAQGGHFLSDVVFSGLIVIGVAWLAHDLIVRHGGIAALSGSRRLGAISLVCLAIGAVSYFFYDRPVAAWAHGLPQRIHPVFEFITQFGFSRGYVVGSGAVFVLIYFLWPRGRVWAWRAAFIFLNVAISGLIVDVVKAIVARARPTLLFAHGEYGFAWFHWNPAYWSFPSGHGATAASLALSLVTIWPRLWPVCWLAALTIMSSRLVLGAHYPSDLLGGFYAAFLTWWCLRPWYQRRISKLTESP